MDTDATVSNYINLGRFIQKELDHYTLVLEKLNCDRVILDFMKCVRENVKHTV